MSVNLCSVETTSTTSLRLEVLWCQDKQLFYDVINRKHFL